MNNRWIWLVPVVLGQACQSSNNPREFESETHFLTYCTTSCGGGLECVCGVCTLPCDSNGDSCSSLASGAACVPVSSGCSGATLSCDMTCQSDEQCDSLGSGARCDDGRGRYAESVAPPVTDSGPNDDTTGIDTGNSNTTGDAVDASSGGTTSNDAANSTEPGTTDNTANSTEPGNTANPSDDSTTTDDTADTTQDNTPTSDAGSTSDGGTATDAGEPNDDAGEPVQPCEERELSVCQDDGECVVAQAHAYAAIESCFAPAFTDVACMPTPGGCGDAETLAVDAHGTCWLFPDTCIPAGFRAPEGNECGGDTLNYCEGTTCATLDADACEQDPNCTPYSASAVDTQNACYQDPPLPVGCLPAAAGCAAAVMAAVDAAGACWLLPASCLPLGYREAQPGECPAESAQCD